MREKGKGKTDRALPVPVRTHKGRKKKINDGLPGKERLAAEGFASCAGGFLIRIKEEEKEKGKGGRNMRGGNKKKRKTGMKSGLRVDIVSFLR